MEAKEVRHFSRNAVGTAHSAQPGWGNATAFLRSQVLYRLAEMMEGKRDELAKAIGETNPIYFDLEAARAAGHPDLLAPPSYLGNAIELGFP